MAVAGGIASLSFAPAGQWALMPAALAVLFWTVARAPSRRDAAAAGFVFALALFGFGLQWIFGALSGYIGLPTAAAAVLASVLCVALSAYPAIAAALCWSAPDVSEADSIKESGPNPPGSWKTDADSHQDELQRTSELAPELNNKVVVFNVRVCFMFAGAWAIGEWLRGRLFSGFPWLAIGYSQPPESPLHGWLPLLGIDGVNLTLALSAAILAFVFRRGARVIGDFPDRARALAMLGLAGLWGGGALAATVEWTRPAGEISVSLLQGNVKQELKWRKGAVEESMQDYLRMAKEAPGQWIILPETALPMRRTDLPAEYAQALNDIAKDKQGAVLSGAFVEEQDRLYNAAVTFGDFPPVDYRKRHLTPYGEYLPFSDLLHPILLAADIPYNNLASGETAEPLSLPGGKAAVSICYEDVFSDEWRDQLPQAQVLINLTNDGWFDGSDMLQQHLQMSQTRAAEFGRSLARATNTGMTALIDHKGRLQKVLPPTTQAALDGTLTLREGATPYVRYGEWPVLLLSSLLIIVARMARK